MIRKCTWGAPEMNFVSKANQKRICAPIPFCGSNKCRDKLRSKGNTPAGAISSWGPSGHNAPCPSLCHLLVLFLLWYFFFFLPTPEVQRVLKTVLGKVGVSSI